MSTEQVDRMPNALCDRWSAASARTHSLKPGFHPNVRNRLRCVRLDEAAANRMLVRSSGNHDWLLANASACVYPGFHPNATHATQAIAFGWKPGLSDVDCRVLYLTLLMVRYIKRDTVPATHYWCKSTRGG